MLRRPPRIKQIKTSGARGAWLMHGIHRNEKIPRSLYGVVVEDDAPEIALAFSTVAMASARIVTVTRVSAYCSSWRFLIYLHFFNPQIFLIQRKMNFFM